MNFLNLEYFVVLAEELNFTKAAKRLFISQQSLSVHIQKLEQFFQADLFDRTPPLSLTEAGQCLYRRSKELLQLRDDTVREIKDIQDFQSSSLTLSCPYAIGKEILPQILPSYTKQYPQIKINLIEGSTSLIEQALLDGRADLALGLTPKNNDSIDVIRLKVDRLLAVVPDKFLPNEHGESIAEAKAALKRGDFSLLSDVPCLLMDPSTNAGMRTKNFLLNLSVSPKEVIKSNNIDMLVELCRNQMGVLFCPEFVMNHKKNNFKNFFTIIPINETCNEAYITISRLKDKYIRKAAVAFIEVTKKIISTQNF